MNFEVNGLKCSSSFILFYHTILSDAKVLVLALLQKFVRCSSGRFSLS